MVFANSLVLGVQSTDSTLDQIGESVSSIVFNPTVRNLRRFDLIRVPAVSDRVSPRKVTVILRSNLLIMNYLLGAFKPACNVSITFTDGKNRKQVPIKKDNGQTVMNPLFQSQETIAGKVIIEPYQGKKVEHNGVKVELLGQIEMYFDRGNFYDFTSLVRELDVPGEIYEKKAYPFEFSTVEMPHETYNGVNVRLRYVLKVTVTRGYGGSIVEYQDFVVRNYSPLPPINNSIKMEVGIEDCLHIEFEYNKSKYHLKDVILGKIYFLLVRIKIKNMDLEIRRRESTGAGANTHVETETLAKFELMDGAPVRGESIPVRLFLTPYDLTPTLTIYAHIHVNIIYTKDKPQ
ncbi:BnaA10g06820D [Brassica napus]|uniref:BnaA10g06820D protein n=1 Tax=Brassica napus TaxID=3708 RepID=A0A078FPV5_BRANA|nr:BnaA10g06820D [Brassica napus]